MEIKKEIEARFEYLQKSGDYGLIKTEGIFGYSVPDAARGMYVLIDNDDIVPIIIEKMLENNVKIYDSIKELPPPTEKIRTARLKERDKEINRQEK